MNIQIENLRTFIAVADTKGFTRASLQVNRPQSTVSMQIKKLEYEIGKPLFQRRGKSIKLTTDGEVLMKYARRIVKHHDNAVMALSNSEQKGVIRFGSPEHYTAGIIPKLLSGFASSYPDLEVELKSGNSDIIKEAVEKGDLDIGICTQIDKGGQVIYHDPMVWMSIESFIFKRESTLPLCVFEKDCIYRHWAIEALEKAAVKYRIAYVTRSISGIQEAVRAGLGIAPVVQSTVPEDLKVVGVEEGFPKLPISNVVLHKVKWHASEMVDDLVEYLIKFFQQKI